MDTSTEPPTHPGQPENRWPEPPRAVSLRGIAILIGVFVFSCAMAIAILRSRHMPTEHSLEFWGRETSDAIRSSSPVELKRPAGATASTELDRHNAGWIDLTELRDIGYFRRVFLDDTHFHWDQVQAKSDREDPSWMHVRFGSHTISFHRNEGWVGPMDSQNVVKLSDQARRRVRYRLELIARIPKEG